LANVTDTQLHNNEIKKANEVMLCILADTLISMAIDGDYDRGVKGTLAAFGQ
jgi:hypothetical protein